MALRMHHATAHQAAADDDGLYDASIDQMCMMHCRMVGADGSWASMLCSPWQLTALTSGSSLSLRNIWR